MGCVGLWELMVVRGPSGGWRRVGLVLCVTQATLNLPDVDVV